MYKIKHNIYIIATMHYRISLITYLAISIYNNFPIILTALQMSSEVFSIPLKDSLFQSLIYSCRRVIHWRISRAGSYSSRYKLAVLSKLLNPDVQQIESSWCNNIKSLSNIIDIEYNICWYIDNINIDIEQNRYRTWYIYWCGRQ